MPREGGKRSQAAKKTSRSMQGKQKHTVDMDTLLEADYGHDRDGNERDRKFKRVEKMTREND